MFEKEHLAIASVPMQRWGELYDEQEALDNGTVFPDLNKPFFVMEGAPVPERKAAGTPGEQQREHMLLQIQKVSFVVDDVRLYMDTHPRDAQGLALLRAMLGKRKQLLKEYAQQFYPLTIDCMADACENVPEGGCYCWQKGPTPWEGACV